MMKCIEKNSIKTVLSKATHLSSPNASIGDMVSIKTGFPIKPSGMTSDLVCLLTYGLISKSIKTQKSEKTAKANRQVDKDKQWAGPRLNLSGVGKVFR